MGQCTDGMVVWIPYRVETRILKDIGFKDESLCLEAAAGYNGLSTYNWYEEPMVFYETDDEDDYNEGLIKMYHCKKITHDNCVYDTELQLWITNKERTICDMIKYDRDLFHLLESIDDYYTYEPRTDESSLDRLHTLAKEYGVYERLQELREESKYIYDED